MDWDDERPIMAWWRTMANLLAGARLLSCLWLFGEHVESKSDTESPRAVVVEVDEEDEDQEDNDDSENDED